MKPSTLYIGSSHDGASRGKFLWKSLQGDFQVDLLVVKSDTLGGVDLLGQGTERSTVLSVSPGKSWFLPRWVFQFSEEELGRYRELILNNEYEYLVVAAVAAVLLAFECERVSPRTKIVVDAGGEKAPCRTSLLSSPRLRRLERRLYRRPYLFLTSGSDKCRELERLYGRGTAPSRFAGFSLEENENAPDLGKEIASFQPGHLKLGIVANRFYPESGGAATNVFLQARALARSGCAVTVFTPKRIEAESFEFVDGIRVKRLWNLTNPFSVFPTDLSKTFCPSLLWHLVRDRFDILQCYPAPHYNAMLGLLVQKLLGKNSVLVSFDLRDYAALIREEGTDVDLLADYEPILRERLAFEWYDHVFAVSNKEVDYIRRYTDSVSQIPLPASVGIAGERIESPRLKYGIPEEAFVFLVVGRLSHAKGQDIAMRAFDEALPQLGDAKLVLVGRQDIEPGFSEELLAYAREHDLSESVRFTGAVDRKETIGWLRHADIHVLPARFMNSSLAIVETWESGTPVIQSDVVDPNLVADDKNGFLFRSESIEDLAETMIRAKERSGSYPSMAEAGMTLVRDRHSYDYLMDLYLKKYRELIGVKTSYNNG